MSLSVPSRPSPGQTGLEYRAVSFIGDRSRPTPPKMPTIFYINEPQPQIN